MSNAAQHTPTPWRVVNGTLIKDEFMPFDRCEEETALVAIASGHTTARSEANAAFIVRACNSHEQLVAALRDCLQLIWAEVADGNYTTQAINAAEALSAAEA